MHMKANQRARILADIAKKIAPNITVYLNFMFSLEFLQNEIKG